MRWDNKNERRWVRRFRESVKANQARVKTRYHRCTSSYRSVKQNDCSQLSLYHKTITPKQLFVVKLPRTQHVLLLIALTRIPKECYNFSESFLHSFHPFTTAAVYRRTQWRCWHHRTCRWRHWLQVRMVVVVMIFMSNQLWHEWLVGEGVDDWNVDGQYVTNRTYVGDPKNTEEFCRFIVVESRHCVETRTSHVHVRTTCQATEIIISRRVSYCNVDDNLYVWKYRPLNVIL